MGTITPTERVEQAIAHTMERYRAKDSEFNVVYGFLTEVGSHISTRGISRGDSRLSSRLYNKCDEGEEALESFLQEILTEFKS